MAWNPSPEVQVARDAAQRLGTLAGGRTAMCVVLYILDDGQAGYASYGRNSALCGMARRLADDLFEHAENAHHRIGEYHIRHDWKPLDKQNPDWKGAMEDVCERIGLLRAGLAAIEGTELRHAYMRDLVLPAMELLARFCACVNIEEPPPPERRHAKRGAPNERE